MVVAEALSHGCPVVVSKGAPWKRLEVEKCGWWVDRDEDSLTAALQEAMNLPDSARQSMGLRGRSWMERDFGWASIARQMNDSYRWIIDGGKPLPWIRID
jgi:glycosyltransferase involved in cell wall biosynthesis